MSPYDRPAMTLTRPDAPLFTIGIAAEMIGVHPQTLRLYERLGFVLPHRTKGKTRLYSQMNIERIRLITTLTRRHRVNLSGVEIILKLQHQIEDIQRETQGLFEALKQTREKERLQPYSSTRRSKTTLSRSPAVKVKVERG